MAILSEQNLKLKVNKKDIVIHPFSENQITGLGIDLSIGWIIPLSETMGYAENEGNYIIPPKCYFLVVTKEHVWISKNLAGTLHSRGTLAAKGIFTNATNVDPNFNGLMIMSLFNVSDKPIVFNKDQTFITLMLHEVKTPSRISRNEIHVKKSIRVVEEMLDHIYSDKQTDQPQHLNLHELLKYLTSSPVQSNEAVFRSLIDKADKKIFSDYFINLLENHRLLKRISDILFFKIIDTIVFLLIFAVAWFLCYLFYQYYYKHAINELDYKLIGALIVSLLSLIALYKKK